MSTSPDWDTNPTTQLLDRYDGSSWKREGDWVVVRHEIPQVDGSTYVRVRGTRPTSPCPPPE